MIEEGDFVIIKDAYDEGMDEDSYPFGFQPEMIIRYGGKKLRVFKVRGIAIELEGGSWYTWHESMFSRVIKSNEIVKKHGDFYT